MVDSLHCSASHLMVQARLPRQLQVTPTPSQMTISSGSTTGMGGLGEMMVEPPPEPPGAGAVPVPLPGGLAAPGWAMGGCGQLGYCGCTGVVGLGAIGIGVVGAGALRKATGTSAGQFWPLHSKEAPGILA
jgi:hypothetical protein